MEESLTPNLEYKPGANEIFSWLSFAGNDERKLLTLLTLATSPEAISRSQIRDNLNDMAGAELPGSKTMYASYINSGFRKLGIIEDSAVVVPHPIKNIIAPGYKIRQEAQNYAIAFAGLFLGWSQETSDLSLIQVFGTQNNKNTNDSSRLRYEIIASLYGLESPQLPKKEIRDKTTVAYAKRTLFLSGIHPPNFNNQVTDLLLRANGLIYADHSVLESGYSTALSIAGNPESVKRLYLKAYNNSPYVPNKA